MNLYHHHHGILTVSTEKACGYLFCFRGSKLPLCI